jgi:hypothetical protein
MGLDGVELVMRFEEAFEISIPDAAVEKLTTPGSVIDYVYTQVPTSNDATCLTQKAFYFLRRHFIQHLQIKRTYFRPERSMDLLLPIENRKAVWSELESKIGTALPMRKGYFNRSYNDVRELAKYIAFNKTSLINGKWTRREIAQVVRDIIIDEIGIVEFTEESHFIQDMGID